MDADSIRQTGQDRYKQSKALYQRLRKEKPRDLDDAAQEYHEEAFAHIDCLDCANCCKTTSPIFKEGDIARLSRALRMKVPEFIDTYLQRDHEGDYVLREAPCPFLAGDNTCIVYEHRPRACREYPHTDRKRFHQIAMLTLKNTLICPAVQHVTRRLEEHYTRN